MRSCTDIIAAVSNSNLRLERDTSTTQKKRKGNKQLSGISVKKQKTVPSDALAIAIGGNTIKYGLINYIAI